VRYLRRGVCPIVVDVTRGWDGAAWDGAAWDEAAWDEAAGGATVGEAVLVVMMITAAAAGEDVMVMVGGMGMRPGNTQVSHHGKIFHSCIVLFYRLFIDPFIAILRLLSRYAQRR
jgi:hypothetical protein